MYRLWGVWNCGIWKMVMIQPMRIPQMPTTDRTMGIKDSPRPRRAPVDTSIIPQMK